MDSSGGCAMSGAGRGMTLLETLAALVLLSALMMTCVPLIQHALRVLRPTHESGADATAEFELARLGDQLVSAREAAQDLLSVRTMKPPWLDGASHDPITVVPLRSDGSSAEHTWVRLQWANHVVYRWIPPRSPESAQHSSGGSP